MWNFNLHVFSIELKMGSTFKKEIFDEHVQVGLVGWAQKAKKRTALNAATEDAAEANPSVEIQMGGVLRDASAQEEIRPSHGSDGSK